jgi:REP-associated tyrosine transposase
VLKTADEKLEQKYALIGQGYDFERTVQRVARVLGMELKEVTTFGKSPRTVKAWALLCFWAHRKLGRTTVEIAEKLSICQSAVRRLSMRGEQFANEQKVDLIETKTWTFFTRPVS